MLVGQFVVRLHDDEWVNDGWHRFRVHNASVNICHFPKSDVLNYPDIVATVIAVDLRTCELNIVIADEQHDLALHEKFAMRPCREKNGNSPDFFASNYDADLKLKRAA